MNSYILLEHLPLTFCLCISSDLSHEKEGSSKYWSPVLVTQEGKSNLPILTNNTQSFSALFILYLLLFETQEKNKRFDTNLF